MSSWDTWTPHRIPSLLSFLSILSYFLPIIYTVLYRLLIPPIITALAPDKPVHLFSLSLTESSNSPTRDNFCIETELNDMTYLTSTLESYREANNTVHRYVLCHLPPLYLYWWRVMKNEHHYTIDEQYSIFGWETIVISLFVSISSWSNFSHEQTFDHYFRVL